MTQGYIGQITDPEAESGVELAARLNTFDAAHKTGQAGPARPSDLGPGGLWTRFVDSIYTPMFFNGVVDKPIARSYAPQIITTTNSYTRPGNDTEGSASDTVSHIPSSTTSHLKVTALIQYSVEVLSGNDARGLIILRNFDGSVWVGGRNYLVGPRNFTGLGTLWGTATIFRILTVENRRSDNGQWSVKLEGTMQSGGSMVVSTTAFELAEFEP